MIPIAHPLFGNDEYDAVLGVLKNGQLAQGQNVAAFERRFAELCGVTEAIAVANGTAALHLALLAHGIGQGDEVITTPFSFAATVNTILLVGATPVLVDIDPDTYNINPDLVEAAITPRTKAIMPVHLYGNPSDMARLVRFANAHGLAIIEDACQAHLATVDGQPVGSFGTGCFSFYATKNMTTGEGGMVTTNDPEIADRLRLLRSHGQRERYYHVAVGYNLRMTEIQGALGVVQVEKLADFNRRRVDNAAYLTSRLAAYVRTPQTLPGHQHVYHQYTIRVPGDRDAWAQTLQSRGIGTGVHYPRPIHQQPFFQERGENISLPVSEAAAREVLSLPVHPALSQSDLEQVAEEVVRLCQ